VIVSLAWCGFCDDRSFLHETPENITTTITPSTTTTSIAPNTTTTGSTTVTTTPQPTQSPLEPKKYTWKVTEGNNTCILLEAGFKLTFNYLEDSGTEVKGYVLNIPGSNKTTANGNCSLPQQKQMISLSFFEDWNLNLTFIMNTTSDKYDIGMVTLDYRITPKYFPGILNASGEQIANATDPMFETDDHKKFVCLSNQKLFHNVNETNGVATIESVMLSFEAFRNSPSTSFTDNAVHCADDEVSQLVPIIVGAALGALIVIVLIAYLIGRRRSRRGYESV